MLCRLNKTKPPYEVRVVIEPILQAGKPSLRGGHLPKITQLIRADLRLETMSLWL